MKTIALRRPDRCCTCSAELAAGVHASWNRVERTVTCLDCATRSTDGAPYRAEVALSPSELGTRAASEQGIAGASAMREYERRHAAREQRAREKLGGVGVVLARVTGDPSSTRVWRQGAEGEERLARRLGKLLDGRGVYLLHDRRVPGRRRANIDHVAVGPGGVTVIDAKTLHGQVRVQSVGGLFSERRKQLRVAGRDQTRLVGGVQAQAEAVRAVLSDAGHAQVDVRCALCFLETDGLPMFARLEIDGTIIDNPKRVAKLAARPGDLRDADVRALHATLASLLPVA